jgi:hypothetical protein
VIRSALKLPSWLHQTRASWAGVATLVEFPGASCERERVYYARFAPPKPPLVKSFNWALQRAPPVACESLMKASQFSSQRRQCGIAVCAVLLAVAMLSRAASTPQQANGGRAQNQVANRLTQSTSRIAKKPRAPEEEFWCSIIDSATAQATALEPAMRSFVLDAVASALKKCDPGKVRKVLVDAFNATLEIPETEEQNEEQWGTYEGSPDPVVVTARTKLETKDQLQISALADLLAVDEAKAESLLPRSEPMVRQLLSLQIISDAAHAGQFDRALRFLNQLPLDLGFPYGAATELMLVLPPERNAQKQEIFLRAMASDREAPTLSIGGDDFASMVVRFWRHLPPATTLAAIRQVLDEAQSDKAPITLRSASASVSFNSAYEYRIFELLPILRELDNAEAEKLLEASVQAKTQLERLPNGIQSLDPTIRDTPLKDGERSDITSAIGAQGLGSLLRQADPNNSRVQEIAHMAETDPRRAIAAAASLPSTASQTDLRVETLIAIARRTMNSNPSAARDALEQMATSLKDSTASSLKNGLNNYWVEGIDISIQIGEVALAQRLLKSGMEQAEKLREEDADEDNPNLALKASWPSAAAFSRLVSAALHIAPQTALTAVKEIPDPQLQMICEIRLAAAGLGVSSGRSTIKTRKLRTSG